MMTYEVYGFCGKEIVTAASPFAACRKAWARGLAGEYTVYEYRRVQPGAPGLGVGRRAKARRRRAPNPGPVWTIANETVQKPWIVHVYFGARVAPDVVERFPTRREAVAFARSYRACYGENAYVFEHGMPNTLGDFASQDDPEAGDACPYCGAALLSCSPSGNGRAACDHCQTYWG